MPLRTSPIHYIDFYKSDHRRQYPAGTTLVVSNLTPRKSRLPGVDSMVFFSLQARLIDMVDEWERGFFRRPKDEVIRAYKRRMDTSLGLNDIGTDHISELHDYGRLPLNVNALPEGTLVPMRVPCMKMWNSDPRFFWFTNYVEVMLSSVLWGPCTSATIANEYRKLLDHWCEETGGDPSFVQWQGHDFSFRGMRGIDDACSSSAGHLLSFTGTDTVPAIDWLEQYYGADADRELIGGSVPATEHSVMCMGTMEDEIGTFRRLITETYPRGIVSIVSDTWDLFRVLTEYLPSLKATIDSRDGKVVIRPDSGDPVDILCGTKRERSAPTAEGVPVPEGCTPEELGVVEILWNVFGGTKTSKGYDVLKSVIGTIYGDSITLERAGQICARLAAKGFASTNVVLGIGSYTYVYNTRDTFGMAIKGTYGEVAGTPREIYKQPKTDDGTKNSARGLIAVNWVDGRLTLRDRVSWAEFSSDAMLPKMVDGTVIATETLSAMRERLASQRNTARVARNLSVA